jgi:hypothetical protein
VKRWHAKTTVKRRLAFLDTTAERLGKLISSAAFLPVLPGPPRLPLRLGVSFLAGKSEEPAPILEPEAFAEGFIEDRVRRVQS